MSKPNLIRSDTRALYWSYSSYNPSTAIIASTASAARSAPPPATPKFWT